MSEKPMMKKSELRISDIRRPAGSFWSASWSETPVTKDRYEGKSGIVQGEKNEAKPAKKAVEIVSVSVIVLDFPSVPDQVNCCLLLTHNRAA